jgi:hypothetical protein
MVSSWIQVYLKVFNIAFTINLSKDGVVHNNAKLIIVHFFKSINQIKVIAVSIVLDMWLTLTLKIPTKN